MYGTARAVKHITSLKRNQWVLDNLQLNYLYLAYGRAYWTNGYLAVSENTGLSKDFYEAHPLNKHAKVSDGADPGIPQQIEALMEIASARTQDIVKGRELYGTARKLIKADEVYMPLGKAVVNPQFVADLTSALKSTEFAIFSSGALATIKLRWKGGAAAIAPLYRRS